MVINPFIFFGGLDSSLLVAESAFCLFWGYDVFLSLSLRVCMCVCVQCYMCACRLFVFI